MAGEMQDDILKVILSEEEIKARIAVLGKQIAEDYAGKNPIFVGVLKGCFVFMADLVRSADIRCTTDFIVASSYGSGTSTTGNVKILKDIYQNVEGRHIILIDDILDTGVTLNYLKNFLQQRNPASIRFAALLDKPARRQVDITADYVGFNVPDEFVVGYGLDYDEAYRNLPFIGVLKPEVYTK